MDALYKVLQDSGVPLSDMLIFLPSRRAVRGLEKFLVDRAGHSIFLPRLVALGEGADENSEEDEEAVDALSDTMRLALITKLLVADASIGNVVTALPVAHDLLRMQDYLENEGVDVTEINWMELVDDKYAAHFQHKAKLLNILSEAQKLVTSNKPTKTQVRNSDIRAWIKSLDKYKLVVVCGSTASVPATADLMEAIAKMPNGRIILSGHIDGRHEDFILATNPYNAEYKFLNRIGVSMQELVPIDVGKSCINFFNCAFGNDTDIPQEFTDLSHCHLINCERESEEAAVVAEIAVQAVEENKTVLVITPDAAGNQRIAAEFKARGLKADFSGAIPGTRTLLGRAILNKFDEWIENSDTSFFDNVYSSCGYDLIRTLVSIIDDYELEFEPKFLLDESDSIQIWQALKELSECLKTLNMRLTLADARSFIADALSSVQVRSQIDEDVKIIVLGTIESRMQTADVVILTALNDGMFPAQGYENAWLPRDIAEKIGLPSPDRKVSLQALDFMNLSCGKDVFWTRSSTSGGVKTMPSRFLSRVAVRRGKYDVDFEKSVLSIVRGRDKVELLPLDYSAPCPPVDWGDIYVTDLELLIHNPYAFYVRHLLRLRVLNDYWALPDARDFGNLVHEVIEKSSDFSPTTLVQEMDARALEKLGADSVLFHFWHKRFLEIAPVVANLMTDLVGSVPEIDGKITIDGHTVRARADRIWDGGVMDIKTGAVPSKSNLEKGTMPQLPLEAYILQKGGFPIKTTIKSQTPVMMFLQLKNRDVKTVNYDSVVTEQMMKAAVEKVKQVIDIFLVGRAPYEYRQTHEAKYKMYDDLARCND